MGGVQQSSYLVDGQGLGEVAPLTRGMQLRSSISSDRPFGERVLVEPANCRRRARHGRCGGRISRDLSRRQTHHVVLDVAHTDVPDIGLSAILHVTRVSGGVPAIV